MLDAAVAARHARAARRERAAFHPPHRIHVQAGKRTPRMAGRGQRLSACARRDRRRFRWHSLLQVPAERSAGRPSARRPKRFRWPARPRVSRNSRGRWARASPPVSRTVSTSKSCRTRNTCGRTRSASGVRASPGARSRKSSWRKTGTSSALRLADGTRVEADLFVDCSGAAARLIRHVSSNERDDWSAWLPCDRMLSAIRPRAARSAARDANRGEPRRAGCGGRRSRTARWWATCTAAHFSTTRRRAPRSRHSSPGCAANSCDAVFIRAPPRFLGAQLRRARSRRRSSSSRSRAPACTSRNSASQRSSSSFPSNRESSIEAREYNRVMGEHARRAARLHHRALSGRARARPGDFWTAARAAAPPANLAHKLDLFAASGRINLLDHETFEEVDWAWLLLGAGCVPAALELQTRAASREAQGPGHLRAACARSAGGRLDAAARGIRPPRSASHGGASSEEES